MSTYIDPTIAQSIREINTDYEKNINRKELQFQYEKARELQHQKISENRKKHIDEVTIRENGTLAIETRNLEIPTTARQVCNFSNPHLVCLISENNIESVGLFTCEIGTKDIEIYVNSNRAGDPEYLLRKFNAAGCEIYARNRRLQKEYLLKIWNAVCNTEKCEMMIPYNHGWWKDRDGSWKFAEQSQKIWEEVKKCSE